MEPRHWILSGALLAALGVTLGAFGAHVLRDEPQRRFGWAEPDVERRLNNFEVAVRYQMYHAIALVLVGLLAARRPSKAAQAAGWCFLVGVLIFSGLLYALTFAGDELRWLGAVVPIGGVLLIAGWLALAAAAVAWGRSPNAGQDS